MVKSQYLYWFSPLPAGSIPAAAYLSTLAAHERQGLSFQMSKAAVVLGNNRSTGTQRGKMTRKIFLRVILPRCVPVLRLLPSTTAAFDI